MFRGATVLCPLFLVVVVGSGPSLAAPPSPYSLTHEELTMSVLVNQLAIIRGMNEPTSFASHNNELNQLREDMEKGWQTLNETVMEGINEMDEIMNETLMATNGVNDRMEEINSTLHLEINLLNEAINTKVERLNKIGESRERAINEMKNTIQSMDRNIHRELRELGEQMEDEINYKMKVINQTIYREMDEMNAKRMNDTQHVMEKLDVVQNATAVHHQWPDQADLYVSHNGSYESLCDGNKVLYGGHGVLKVGNSETYPNNKDCTWTVILPEGSRPVFRWPYFSIQECSFSCTCDYVYIKDVDHRWRVRSCGDTPPDGSFYTVMNNKFKVGFHSDGSGTGRGFQLQYRAVEMN